MQNFFWEGNSGSKINHLVSWRKVTPSQLDGGMGLGGIRIQNNALLAKWAWRYMKEDTTLWRKVLGSIHGSETFDRNILNKSGNSLRSSWVSISRAWKKVEILAWFKLGNGRRQEFWADSWAGEIPLKNQYMKQFRIALLPTG